MTATAFSAPGRFYRGNLHTHSTRSDGVRPPEEVCATYRDAGYDFLCLSDHFLAKFGFPITDTRAFRTAGFTTLLGAEVHSGATRFGGAWHILAVGLPPDFAPTRDEEDGPALARRCRDAGAFVAVAHPGWYGLGVDEALTIDAAHAVELYNHSCQVECDRADDTHFFDQVLSLGRRWTACATDDAHFRIADWCGGWVMVKSAALEPEALVAALRNGAYYSSTGPSIFDMKVGRNEVEIRCSPAARVHLLGQGSAAAWRHGHALTRVVFELASLKQSPWFRVAVVDACGKRAWTNPVWL